MGCCFAFNWLNNPNVRALRQCLSHYNLFGHWRQRYGHGLLLCSVLTAVPRHSRSPHSSRRLRCHHLRRGRLSTAARGVSVRCELSKSLSIHLTRPTCRETLCSWELRTGIHSWVSVHLDCPEDCLAQFRCRETQGDCCSDRGSGSRHTS